MKKNSENIGKSLHCIGQNLLKYNTYTCIVLQKLGIEWEMLYQICCTSLILVQLSWPISYDSQT